MLAMQVEIRRGRGLVQRPHSDGGRNRRRSSYAPSETSSSFSDDVLFPQTPSSPLPSHSLLSPQVHPFGLILHLNNDAYDSLFQCIQMFD